MSSDRSRDGVLLRADRIVTGEEVLTPGWIEVADDAVVALGPGDAPRRPDHDLVGATVVPGFVDTHVHGGGGGTFSDATEQSTRAAVDLHRRHGTTTLLASLVSAPAGALLHQVEVLAGQVDDGLLAGIHLEGPWLSRQRCGAHDPSALRPPDPAEIAALLAAGAGTIRMATLAPELEGSLPAIRRLVDAGVVVAVGHTDATYAVVREAIDAGATVATHLFNAMRAIHHREPGPVVALLADPRVTLEMVTDGTHLHPALHRQVMAQVGPDRVSLVTDAMAAAGMRDGSYPLGALSVDVVDGVARVAGADTIAGSTATMDHLFRTVVHGLDDDRDAALLAAARQTSVNPARALGLPPAGLSPGRPADLVVLDDELSVGAVMRQGCWITAPAAASG